jgi:hypothetical protein
MVTIYQTTQHYFYPKRLTLHQYFCDNLNIRSTALSTFGLVQLFSGHNLERNKYISTSIFRVI